jgi:pyrroline-5-carboxylate reductase
MASQVLGQRQIGFVGGGNMAEALIRGLLESGACSANAIRVSDLSADRREHLEGRYGIEATDDNAALASWADLLLLAVKPQVMSVALASLKSGLRPEDTLVVSIAAGVETARIEAELDAEVAVVRVMPNTAAMVRESASAVSAGKFAAEADVALAVSLLSAVGRTVVVPEKALDAVTGLSGSGPAYVMLFIESLTDGGVKAGLPRDVAMTLAAQTVYGAAKLQIDSGEAPAVLRDRVTSPGGTTVAGLAHLEEAGVRAAVIGAVVAATRRSSELGSA